MSKTIAISIILHQKTARSVCMDLIADVYLYLPMKLYLRLQPGTKTYPTHYPTRKSVPNHNPPHHSPSYLSYSQPQSPLSNQSTSTGCNLAKSPPSPVNATSSTKPPSKNTTFILGGLKHWIHLYPQ